MVEAVTGALVDMSDVIPPVPEGAWLFAAGFRDLGQMRFAELVEGRGFALVADGG